MNSQRFILELQMWKKPKNRVFSKWNESDSNRYMSRIEYKVIIRGKLQENRLRHYRYATIPTKIGERSLQTLLFSLFRRFLYCSYIFGDHISHKSSKKLVDNFMLSRVIERIRTTIFCLRGRRTNHYTTITRGEGGRPPSLIYRLLYVLLLVVFLWNRLCRDSSPSQPYDERAPPLSYNWSVYES